MKLRSPPGTSFIYSFIIYFFIYSLNLLQDFPKQQEFDQLTSPVPTENLRNVLVNSGCRKIHLKTE